MQKLDPLYQCRPGHDEPLPAWRGVRHRRRCGDPISTLGHYERFIDEKPPPRLERPRRAPIYQSVNRQGAPGRLPRRDRAGHPPHHHRDQGPHQAGGQGEPCRRGDPPRSGGTVGDIEEASHSSRGAIRQLRLDIGRDNLCYVPRHPPRPTSGRRGELKDQAHPALGPASCARSVSSPTPSVLRSDPPHLAGDEAQDRPAVRRGDAGHWPRQRTRTNIYRDPAPPCTPEGLDDFVLDQPADGRPPAGTSPSGSSSSRGWKHPKSRVRIGARRQVTWTSPTAYPSRSSRALKAGGYAAEAEVEIVWVSSDENGHGSAPRPVPQRHSARPTFPTADPSWVAGLDGILRPPEGFGIRGIEGQDRGHPHPAPGGGHFPLSSGSALGLQCAVIEYARNVAGLEGAQLVGVRQSTPPSGHRPAPPARRSVDDKGGNHAASACGPPRLAPGSVAHETLRRRRHLRAPPATRYEVNPAYHPDPRGCGLAVSPAFSPPERQASPRSSKLAGPTPSLWEASSHPEFRLPAETVLHPAVSPAS